MSARTQNARHTSVATVLLFAATLLLPGPTAGAAVIKKGGACPKAKVGETVVGPRETPYVCTKVKTKYVWALTSAGDGSAAATASSKLPPAFAGTFTVTNAVGTLSGTMWWGLTEGDLKSSYYNQSTMVWTFTNPAGCGLSGTTEGIGQLAVYDNVTRYDLRMMPFMTLACPGGTVTVNTGRLSDPQMMLTTGGLLTEMTFSAKGAPAGRVFIGVLGTPAGVKTTVASAAPTNTFTGEFALAPSTLEARPPKP